MTITKENEGKVLMENVYIENEDFKICSWYGGESFEIVDSFNNDIPIMSRKRFLKFAEMVDKMREEITRFDREGA